MKRTLDDNHILQTRRKVKHDSLHTVSATGTVIQGPDPTPAEVAQARNIILRHCSSLSKQDQEQHAPRHIPPTSLLLTAGP